MSLSNLYEQAFGRQNIVPGSELDKAAAATNELAKEAEAHGRLIARAYASIRLGRLQAMMEQ